MSAEIRRLKERIAELKVKSLDEGVIEQQFGDITLITDHDENRIRLVFPGKPSQAVIDECKRRGFKWSPSNKAWQRQLTIQAEYSAKFVIEFAQAEAK